MALLSKYNNLFTFLTIVTFAFCLNFSVLGSKSLRGVDWFQGTVKQAMVKAEKEQKPLFLYWGAVWCPPCNQIKRTIFSKSEFHRESKNFVNVYLDGDNPNAQKWGNHFGAVGYPTMMILNPKGEEITRLPSGLSVFRYVSLMKKTRLELVPIDKIVKKALASTATKADWERLAGYSWGQDRKMQGSFLSEKNKASTYSLLFQNSPKQPSYIRAYFFLRSQLSLFKNKKFKASKEQAETFYNILKVEELQKGSASILSYYSKKFSKFYGPLLGKEKFKRAYLKAMKRIRSNNSEDLKIRLSTLAADIDLCGEKVDQKIKNQVQRWSEKVEKEAEGDYERQSMISSAIWLLEKSDQRSLAKKMAKREILKSSSPYYFMSYLGSMELEDKNIGSGITWYKKAWGSAKGPATRFQWGTSYLQKLMKYSSNNSKLIIKTGQELIKELLENEDAFLGRNKTRLDRIQKSFSNWKKEQRKDANILKSKWKTLCESISTKMLNKDCHRWVKAL
jgi:thioredoxin-related protein